jgi:hypothetical protein
MEEVETGEESPIRGGLGGSGLGRVEGGVGQGGGRVPVCGRLA